MLHTLAVPLVLCMLLFMSLISHWGFSMNSFRQHVQNIKDLEDMGFDVSTAYEQGEVTEDSWDHHELVDLISSLIYEIKEREKLNE